MEFRVDWGSTGTNDAIFFVGASFHDYTFFSITSAYPTLYFNEQSFACLDDEHETLSFWDIDNDRKVDFDFTSNDYVKLTYFNLNKQSQLWESGGRYQKLTPMTSPQK